MAEQRPSLAVLFRVAEPGQVLYSWPVTLGCLAAAVIPLLWLRRLPYQATREEQISDARARQPHHPLTAGAAGSAE
jgi:hypothetical protein